MAVGYDTEATNLTGSGLSITIGNNPGRCLFAIVSAQGDKDDPCSIAGVSGGGGGAWTQVAAVAVNTANVAAALAIWRSTAPATGAQTITPSFAGNVGDAQLALVSLFGVDQASPIAGSATNSGTGTAVSVALSSTTNNYLLEGAITDNGASTITGSGVGTLIQKGTGANYLADYGHGRKLSTGGSQSSSWTLAVSKAWADVAVSVAEGFPAIARQSFPEPALAGWF